MPCIEYVEQVSLNISNWEIIISLISFPSELKKLINSVSNFTEFLKIIVNFLEICAFILVTNFKNNSWCFENLLTIDYNTT